jgi:hypothetical protein
MRNINWETIHDHPKNNDINGLGKECNWQVNSNSYYRTFKITQLGARDAPSGEEYVFTFNKIEFFGDFSFVQIICSHKIQKSSYIIYYFIFLVNKQYCN